MFTQAQLNGLVPKFVQWIPGMSHVQPGTTLLGSLFFLLVFSIISSISPGLEVAACFLFGKTRPIRGVYTSIGHNGIEACAFIIATIFLLLFQSVVDTFLDFVVSNPVKIILNALFILCILFIVRDLLSEVYEQFYIGRSQIDMIEERTKTDSEFHGQTEKHITNTYCLIYGIVIGSMNFWSWVYLAIVIAVTEILIIHHLFVWWYVPLAIICHSGYDVVQCFVVSWIGNQTLNVDTRSSDTWSFGKVVQAIIYFCLFAFSVIMIVGCVQTIISLL